jgi:hypothetical protein
MAGQENQKEPLSPSSRKSNFKKNTKRSRDKKGVNTKIMLIQVFLEQKLQQKVLNIVKMMFLQDSLKATKIIKK